MSALSRFSACQKSECGESGGKPLRRYSETVVYHEAEPLPPLAGGIKGLSRGVRIASAVGMKSLLNFGSLSGPDTIRLEKLKKKKLILEGFCARRTGMGF